MQKQNASQCGGLSTLSSGSCDDRQQPPKGGANPVADSRSLPKEPGGQGIPRSSNTECSPTSQFAGSLRARWVVSGNFAILAIAGESKKALAPSKIGKSPSLPRI